jgi:hypothetical protein
MYRFRIHDFILFYMGSFLIKSVNKIENNVLELGLRILINKYFYIDFNTFNRENFRLHIENTFFSLCDPLLPTFFVNNGRILKFWHPFPPLIIQYKLLKN